MSDGMGRELAYLSSHATNRYFIPNWGNLFDFELDAEDMQAIANLDTAHSLFLDHHSGETTKQFMEWRAVVKPTK